MVYKVSKGGVRSGNTLRGLRTRRTQQYGRHACLVGFSNLGEQKLKNLLYESSEENKLVGDTLRRTNVLLSLNKKQRWDVPAALKQMISGGFFDKHKVISMLERHKLKRRANCVQFASNGGKLQSIIPKCKKYFSFSLDTIHEEESNRERRRRMAEKLRNEKASSSHEKGIKTVNGFMKVIDTHTSEGKSNTFIDAIQDSSKDEYRVEIFYPCPQSCSLTFNPKYTDVILEEGKSGRLEVKSNVRTFQRGKKHHRQCFLNKRYFDFFSEETIEEDVTEMWKECDDSELEEKDYTNEIPHHSSYFDDIELLLDQAEKARGILGKSKRNNRKRSYSQKHIPGSVGETKAKNHSIHYVDYDQERSLFTQERILSPKLFQDQKSRVMKPLDSIKVILKSNETSVECLKEKYGHLYSEGCSEPRRFLINVTHDLANIFSVSKSSNKNLKFASYIVFVHDGIYDDGLDVFRFIFNSNLCERSFNLSDHIPFSVTTIDSMMNQIIEFLLDSNVKQEIESANFNDHTQKGPGTCDFLNRCMNVKVNILNPSHALAEKPNFTEECENEILSLINPFGRLSNDFDEEIFCDICYDSINPTRIKAVNGTKLLKCGHNCCDNCWALHFDSRIRDSVTSLTCPGYDCQSEIGFVTLLSILHVSQVALMFQRKTEQIIEAWDNAKWCPNPDCGLVIKIDSKSNDLCQDVECACGMVICFSCFGPAHWPAKCDQAEMYQDKLLTLQPPVETVDEEELKVVRPDSSPKYIEIVGRVCPRCFKFIDKNGGCRNMICKCGYCFCWDCMRPVHSNECSVDNFLMKHTRLIRIAHKKRQQGIAYPQSSHKGTSKKQKATIYQRALQQRLEASQLPSTNSCKGLIKKIVAAARKDSSFKQKIIDTMHLRSTSASGKEKCLLPEAVNIESSISGLIKTSQEIKTVLHHVVEFSYVLLQDAPNSEAKQRMIRLANDLSGICSFFKSILDLGENQNPQTAFHRLVSIQSWAKRALDALIITTRHFRQE